jgi:hypothetical protein
MFRCSMKPDTGRESVVPTVVRVGGAAHRSDPRGWICVPTLCRRAPGLKPRTRKSTARIKNARRRKVRGRTCGQILHRASQRTKGNKKGRRENPPPLRIGILAGLVDASRHLHGVCCHPRFWVDAQGVTTGGGGVIAGTLTVMMTGSAGTLTAAQVTVALPPWGRSETVTVVWI